VSLVAAERLRPGGDHSRDVRSGSSQALAMDEQRVHAAPAWDEEHEATPRAPGLLLSCRVKTLKRLDFQELGGFPLGLALPPLLVEISGR